MILFTRLCGLLVRHCAAFLLLVFCAAHVQAQSISVGPFGPGITTGSEPFNVTGTCSDAGDDCSATDNRIRTADRQSHFYSIVVSGIPIGDPDIHSVIVEHTISPDAGAVLEYEPIPPICLAPPQGTGGVSPASTLSQNADGSTTLFCNLGSMRNGNQKSFAIDFMPSPASVNGATFSTSIDAYGLDANDNPVTASQLSQEAVFEISAAPTWDLIGDRRAIYSAYVGARDMGTGRGIETGYYLYTTAHLAADASSSGKGLSELGDQFTFDFGLTATASDGITSYPIEAQIVHCLPNTSAWGDTVFGNESVLPAKSIEQKVVDSGSCQYSGDPVNGYSLTIDGADTAVTRYPSQSANGLSLEAGPYFTMSHRIHFFIPFSEIDRENAQVGTGAINVTQCFNNFDPIDAQGLSNYGAGLEPGYNGNTMPDGGASNNCSGPLLLELSTGARFNHRAISRYNASNQWGYDPYITTYQSGDGLVEAGVGYAFFNYLQNSGSVAWNNPMQCTTFDNSTQKLADRSKIGHTAGDYAFVRYLGGMVESEWQIEYASVDQSTVDPLDRDGDGNTDFNNITNRYEGTWVDLQNFRCDTPNVIWNTDPTVIGIDRVNAVRVVPKDPTLTVFGAGENPWLIVPLEARSTFFGGPYDGTELRPGTVLASASNYRGDEFLPQGVTNTYLASPENTSVFGDRMTYSQVRLEVTKSTFSPQASAGDATQLLAGKPVVWELAPSVSSNLVTGGTALGAELIDVLPAALIYDQQCTLDNGGTTPTQVLYNTPSQGETTLQWPLGDVLSLDAIDPIRFCTITEITTPSDTRVTNRAYMDASNAVPSAVAEQSVVLAQAGTMGATAKLDVPVDLINDSQEHTLLWANFSENIGISQPSMINVLPYNGDSSGLSARFPGSNFTGQIQLSGPATQSWPSGSQPGDLASDQHTTLGSIYYSADVPDTINHNPDENISDWCEWTGTAYVPQASGMSCPLNWGEVTAIKHVANYDLEKSGDPRQSIQLQYQLNATNNASGDQYVNVFGIDSVDLPANQFIEASRSIVNIASFSIGDLVYVDHDGDGQFNAAVDEPVPDGLALELRDASTDALISSTLTQDGTYLFDGLSFGDFYVTIPDAWFASGGLLEDWIVSPDAQPANSDNNHDADHNAFASNPLTNFGARSDTITLSTTLPASGAAPSGDEPVGDNIIPIADINTNDSFSNLTIDFALQAGDLDNDGISDLEEYGSTGFNAAVDTDSDGIPDFRDIDSDGDGINDNVESSADFDSDGIPNYLDTDADNDGVLDTDESQDDLDGDGLANFIDSDSDNDGISDAVEFSTGDVDGDGIENSDDVDSDNDGLPDAFEGVSVQGIVDTDSDGLPNFIDLDSDNDGIDDAVEAPVSGVDTDADGIDDFFDVDVTGGIDLNNDGLDDNVVAQGVRDSDNDGNPDYLDTDSDADGMPDSIETLADNDLDGLGNYIDIDSDNDGLLDTLEAGAIPVTPSDTDGDGLINAYDTDSDNDGISDAVEGNVDTDNDGFGNYLDTDSDGDRILDAVEGVGDTDADGIANFLDAHVGDAVVTNGLDSDNDGIVDAVEGSGDADFDGIPDYLDVDADNDGIPDSFEGTSDADLDGIPDYLDIDTDNDGILDSIEGTVDSDLGGIPDFLDVDSDKDGLLDSVEGVIDTDLDGFPNYLDLDSDNDGIPDEVESSLEVDNDIDTDSDGVPNYLDLDSDNDGFLDSDEGTGDSDGDGIPDYLDAAIFNDGVLQNTNPLSPQFIDSDNDGIPNAEERDGDAEGDGIPNELDLDSDNDGIPDSIETQIDTDADGVPDYLDVDSDNDGLTDIVEAGGVDINADGRVDDFIDSNNDGLDDAVAALPLPNDDFDNDGIPNRLDIDSDNDNTADLAQAGGADLDQDGDGVIDNFVDANNDGLDDGLGVAPLQFMDRDGTRFPDLSGLSSRQRRQALPTTESLPRSAGSGCSVSLENRADSRIESRAKPIEPTLVSLLVFAMIMIGWRSIRGKTEFDRCSR